MTNVINMGDYRAPVTLPAELRNAKSWLVWRLVHKLGDPKPKKIPFYITGQAREGRQADDGHMLVSFDRAVAAVVKGGYSGVGLAMRASLGLVALDFDDCVKDGELLPAVADLVEGTYCEFSPSGTGVRAFFKGALRDRKSKGKGPFDVEFFHASGYVTVTGNVTPDCEMWSLTETIAPLSDAVRALYAERFGQSVDASLQAGSGVGSGLDGDDDSWLLTVAPKVGLSLEKARAMVGALDAGCGYDEWRECGMALHHEFNGSDAALGIWQEWSRKSAEKYPGDKALRDKWESFGRYTGSPITATWLLKHSKVAKVASRYEAAAEWNHQVAAAVDEYDLREKVCTGIAKDSRLDDVDREALAQLLVDRFREVGVKLPIATVRKLVRHEEAKVPVIKRRRPLTEFGNVERMLDRYGDSLMYAPETDSWFCWNGVYWRATTDVEIQHYAKETVVLLREEAEEHDGDQGEFYAFAAESQRAAMVRNMVALATSDPRVLVEASAMDAQVFMLCVQNGVVDLRTGILRAPDRSLRMTKVAACDYRPDARADLFRQTVLDVFSGDAEMAGFFQRIVGYSVLGQPTEDIIVIAHGDGSNGKSTVLGAIRKALGSYAKSADAATFVSDPGRGGGNAGGPREDLLRLKGARFVYVNEPDENSELREGQVKAMTGGDAITARGMFAKSSVEIVPQWVAFMPTNHKPIIKGSDNGIWRRLVLVPFTRNFENDPTIVKDEKRAEKLDAEAEGVLAWCVEGARAYLDRGLSPPAGVRQAREQYRSQMDLLAEWLEDCCDIEPTAGESMQNLWRSWEAFARERGILNYVKSSIALGKRLDQRFPAVKGNRGVRVRVGLRLKAGGEFVSQEYQSALDDFFS